MNITTCRKPIPVAIAVIALSILAAPRAKAACTAHTGGGMFAPGLESLQDLAAPDQENSSEEAGPVEADRGKNDSRVTVLGLWKKVWFAGGAFNDVGFAHFNAGGTELVNDVGALNAGTNFCIGAWKQVGRRRYELVHPFFVFDDSAKNVIGVAIEKSELTVSRDGNRFRGTWTQDNYDLSGNLVPGFHFDGTIIGTRITPGGSFPFPFPY
jgi:hypothetical protein